MGLKKPAPDSILEFASCSCKRSRCTGGACGCFKLVFRAANYVSALTENLCNESLAEDDNDISHHDIDSEAELDDTYDDDAEI